MDKNNKRSLCRRYNSIFVFSFLVLMLLHILQPVKEYSEIENRYLQKFPEFSVKSLLSGEYMSDVESYLNDHFFGRNFFVSLKSKIEYLTGKKENNGVYVCADDYLIEKPQNYDKQLVAANVQAIKDLEKTGRFNVYVTVIPTAYEILQEKLPKNVYRNTLLRVHEDVEKSFQDTAITYSDTTELLKKYNEDYLYYKTDHHLTAHGSFVVYHGLSEMLGYEALKEEDFKVSDVSRTFYGTTYSKSLLKASPDVITEYKPLETPRFKVLFPYENAVADSMYFPAHLTEKDQYSYYLDGNHALTVVESPNKNGKSLVVFKDSYAHSIVPFLANHYETIHMIDLRYYNDDFIKYMADNDVKDVLFLYSTPTFMSDESIRKVTSYSKNSPYLIQGYGKVASSKPVGDAYFTDTAFIGDSLTDGFRIYANLPDATFLCGTSMTIDRLSVRPAPDGGTIMQRIEKGGFKKVYIMLGINEYLVEEYRKQFMTKYAKLVDTVKEHNPDAIIYIQSILPVSASKDAEGPLKNEEIRLYNEALLDLALEKEVYYIDVHQYMTDEKGNLIEGSNTDGTHLNKTYYLKWLDCLKTHVVNASDIERAKSYAEQEANIKSVYDVKAIAEMIVGEVKFKDSLAEINRRVMYSSYNLDENKMANAAGYAGGGATAEEIAVFEVKNVKDAEEVEKKALEYIEKRKNSFKSYIPEEMPKLEKPFVFRQGKLVVVCIANDYGNIETKIKKMME